MSTSSAAARLAMIAAALVAMALWFTWPLPVSLGQAAVGSLFPHDQYLSAYLLEWGYEVLWTRPSELFEAPICYPAQSSVASTEHFIGFAPLFGLARTMTADPLVAYHVLLITLFALNALSMAIVVWVWTADALAAILAGACFAFAPSMISLSAWIHVIGAFLFPLILLGLDRTIWGVGRQGALVLAFAAAWQVALTVYGTAFAAIIGGTFLCGQLAVSRRSLPWRRFPIAAAAAAVAAPILFVIAQPYLATSPQGDAQRSLGSMIVSQGVGMIPFDPLGDGIDLLGRLGRVTGLRRHDTFSVDPGRVPMVFALIGFVMLLRVGDAAMRRRLAGLLAVSITGCLLALGPGFLSTPVGTFPLPLLLLDELPIFGGLRFSERFIVIATVGIAAAAGLTFAGLFRNRSGWERVVAFAVLLGLAFWDTPAIGFKPANPATLPSPSAQLLQQSDRSEPVLEWPPLTAACATIFLERSPGEEIIHPRGLGAFARSIQCFERAAQHMMENTQHWHSTNLCFSSYLPAATENLAVLLLSATDAEEFARHVRRARFRWLLVRPSEGILPDTHLAAAGFHLVHADDTTSLYARPDDATALDADEGGDIGPPDDFAGFQPTLSVDIPTRIHTGDVAVVTIRLTNTSRRMWPSDGEAGGNVAHLWAGWRAADGSPVLNLDAEREARLATLPGRWREALREVYSKDQTVGFADRVAPGETHTWQVQTPTRDRPGRYRFAVRVGRAGGALAEGGLEHEVEIEVVPAAKGYVPRLREVPIGTSAS